MMLPDYWMTRPGWNREESAPSAFDDLLQTVFRTGGCPEIDFRLPWPKWQFLCHAAEHHDIVLHGSGDAAISLFEPRQAMDLRDFGKQKAIYATSDGILAIFFAIVDREQYPMSIINASVQIADKTGTFHGPYYVFSVSQLALPHRPWRRGTVYLLPRKTFISDPPFSFGDSQVHVAQVASFEPVQPIAKLTVTAADFPFLNQIRGHDDQRLQEYATAMQTAAPWPGNL